MDVPEVARPPAVDPDKTAPDEPVRGYGPGPVPIEPESSPIEEADAVATEPEPTTNPVRYVVVASILSAFAAAALTVAGLFVFGAFENEPDPIPAENVIRETDVVSSVAAQAIPSIVTVQRFDGEIGLGPVGSGSGVIFRSDGYILTNDHVIAGAASIKILLSDGLAYPAELVGTDPLMDIAVLKIAVEGLSAIEFADLEAANIGDLAIAVGNPLGLDGGPSLTAGVISAFDRQLRTNGFGGGVDLYGLIQTDAPITRGSSGGALLDRDGRLLGITTAIGVSDVGAEGLGFAVASDLVESIAEDLIADGAVAHAFLGISGRSAVVERDDGSELPLGARIESLLEGSAIGEAGAQTGDVIVALDGTAVNSMVLLVAELRHYRAGDTIGVTLDRDGDTIDVTLVLDLYPSS